MNAKHQKTEKHDSKERQAELREGITSADATGMIAGEELITEAESMQGLPAPRPQRWSHKPGSGSA
ncbi:MAG: hypothetical protein ACYDHD_05040 [Vulcanimicrobiaceae bacterium]